MNHGTDSEYRDALGRAYDDVRLVLDTQREHLSALDDKASLALRMDAVLLGLVLTAGSIVIRSDPFTLGDVVNAWIGLGISLVVVSLLAAVYSLTLTETIVGLGQEDVERIARNRYSDEELLVMLLRSSKAWMRTNERVNRHNARAVLATYVFLGGGVVCLVVGVILSPLVPTRGMIP